MPLEVCASVIVGLLNKLQHIPLAVIAAPPSEVIFPPPVEPVELIFVIVVVEIEGKEANVVKL